MGSTPGIVDNSNATAITIDSSENVGIGTSNPDTTLHLQTPNGTKSEINFAQTAVTNYRIGVPASTDALVLTYGASTERMRIDASGLVGIGTSSPTDLLSVGTLGSTASPALTIGSATNGQGQIYFGDGAGAARYRGYIEYVHSSDYMALATEATERLRIDSSGNVGIANVPPAWGTAYVSINIGSTGSLWATRAAASLTVLSDNSYHNGSASIAKNSGPGSLYTQSGGQHTWGNFASVSAGGTQTEVARMRLETAGNLNLLDGNLIFAAGHGVDFSANPHAGQRTSELLDDYEEGTWTAGISGVGGNAAAVNTVQGYYTKIGRNVNIYFYLNSVNLALITSGTYVILTGLPFQADAYSDIQWSYHRGGNAITGGYIQSGTSYVYLVDSSGVEIQQGNNETITALIGSASYMTNS